MGGSLSGGQQQMLAVARALMANPQLMLMDEPSIGLSPLMVEEVGKSSEILTAGALASFWWNRIAYGSGTGPTGLHLGGWKYSSGRRV